MASCPGKKCPRTSLFILRVVVHFTVLSSLPSWALDRQDCCDGGMHAIDWTDDSVGGSWCFLAYGANEHVCDPICLNPQGRKIALDCPMGFAGDCADGCKPGLATAYSQITATESGTNCTFLGSEDLFEWAKESGGFVHSLLEMSTGPDPKAVLRGIFTKGAIAEGERIVMIPKELFILSSPDRKDDCYGCCSAAPVLQTHLQLGRCSPFWPYVKVLSNHEITSPEVWSGEDLALMEGLHGHYRLKWVDSYVKKCGRGRANDSLGRLAMYLWDARNVKVKLDGIEHTALVPVYDSFNHRNGLWHNTVVGTLANGSFIVQTSRDVMEGEQLYLSYSPLWAGAHSILNQYGFVEEPPATWNVDAGDTVYRFIIEDDFGTVTWPDEGAMDFQDFVTHARSLLDHLAHGPTAAYEVPAQDDTTSHRKLALAYRQAYQNAVRFALEDAMRRQEL